jgi:hypothetical protein
LIFLSSRKASTPSTCGIVRSSKIRTISSLFILYIAFISLN